MFLKMQIFAFRDRLRISREMTFQICCYCTPRPNLFESDEFLPALVDDFGLVDLAVSSFANLGEDFEVVDASFAPTQSWMFQSTIHQLLRLEFVVTTPPRTSLK